MKKKYHNQQTYDIFLDPNRIVHQEDLTDLERYKKLFNPKRRLNFLNYSNHPYDILSLEKKNDYYQNFRDNLFNYSRPDYKSLIKNYKKAKNEKNNQFIIRNIKKIKDTNMKTKSKSVNKSVDETNNIVPQSSLFTATKKNDLSKVDQISQRSLTSQIRKRAFSSKSSGKAKSVISSSKTSISNSNTVDPVQRIQNLYNYISKVSDKDKALKYALEVIKTSKVSDITKHQMSETLLSLIEKEISDIVNVEENKCLKDNESKEGTQIDTQKKDAIDEVKKTNIKMSQEPKEEKSQLNLEEIRQNERKIEKDITELYEKLCQIRKLREEKENKVEINNL